MSQNIEIEFKNMLSKEEYLMLIDFFKIQENDIFTQENHYFDTHDFSLKEYGAALRIRQKDGMYEMTLKQPCNEGLLETNQQLTKEEASLAFTNGELPYGMIKDLVLKMGISLSDFEYFGSLLTKRAEIEYKEGLLVLDYSCYLNKEDFELEYEVRNYQDGQTIFLQLLDQHQIPKRETVNKMGRFYLQKYTENKAH